MCVYTCVPVSVETPVYITACPCSEPQNRRSLSIDTSQESDVHFGSITSSSGKLGFLLDFSEIETTEVRIHHAPPQHYVVVVSTAAVHLLCDERSSLCWGPSSKRTACPASDCSSE